MLRCLAMNAWIGLCALLLGCSSGPGTVGDPCACNSDCADGLYCSEEADPPLDLGSSCNGDPAGECRAPHREGESCDVLQSIRCDASLVCIGGVCRTGQGVEGDPCETDAHCTGDLLCNTGVNPPVCLPLGDEGDPCSTDECIAGLVCNTGECLPPATAGATCSADDDCATDLYCREAGCLQLSCSNGHCDALGAGAPGESCRTDEQCASGICDLAQGDGYQTLRCS